MLRSGDFMQKRDSPLKGLSISMLIIYFFLHIFPHRLIRELMLKEFPNDYRAGKLNTGFLTIGLQPARIYASGFRLFYPIPDQSFQQAYPLE